VKSEATRSVPPDGLGAMPDGGPESAWIRSARDGDREAFGRLVLRHQDAVLTAVRYMVADQEDAEDIAQETFLRAWRSLSGFAGHSSFRTWVLVIAANAARSHAARKMAKKRAGKVVRLESRSGEEIVEVPEPDGRGSPEDRAIRMELKEELEAAILALDDESRSLVVLRDLLGESYEAIAEAQGLPLGTVKSRIHRARLEIRDRLERYLR
jgi:RNA polymerase sigma-70 factor (ECF subfamily)